jgi:hypothetical protein
MGIGLTNWASAKVNAAGAFIDQDGGFVSVAKVSTGVYELVLARALGVAECCPWVTPWYKASTDPVPKLVPAVGLKSDGVTVVVNLFDPLFLVSDGAFCVVVSRFEPA